MVLVGATDDREGNRMNTPLNEADLIEITHITARTPTPGDHDVREPDPYCFGDDPCVCVQIKAAREDERRRTQS